MDRFTKAYLKCINLINESKKKSSKKIIKEQAGKTDLYLHFVAYGPENSPQDMNLNTYEDFCKYIDEDLYPNFLKRFNVWGEDWTMSDPGGNSRDFEAHVTSYEELRALLKYRDNYWMAEPLTQFMDVEDENEIDKMSDKELEAMIDNSKDFDGSLSVGEPSMNSNMMEPEELAEETKNAAQNWYEDEDEDDDDEE